MATTTTPRVGTWDAREAVSNLRPFRTHGALCAVAGPADTSGKMSRARWDRYRADREHIVYTVVSYSTPILWVLDDGTVVDAASGYSRTTTRHRTACWPLFYATGEGGTVADPARRPLVTL